MQLEKIVPEKIYEQFNEWSKENPGTWINRSMKAAEAAKSIAEAIRTR